jgi:O-antigen ligase
MMQAASMVISDYPLGVGANRYVVVANLGGYSARANLPWNQANRAAPVHNTYYLVTAEMGWLGLIAFMALLAAAIVTSIRVLRRSTPRFESEYVAGIATSFVMVAAHAYVEWVTMNSVIHVLFAINLGVVVAAYAAMKRRSSEWVSQNRVAARQLPETSPA